MNLIVREREWPVSILQLDTLLRRLPLFHPSRIRIEELRGNYLAGFNGEESIDRYLKDLDNEQYLILHDIRLPGRHGYYFQIDTLILSEQFFAILEVKNIYGSLYFDQVFYQLIRTTNEKVEVFSDPITQVLEQEIQLKFWLKKNKLPSIPIASFVIVSKPSTQINTDPQHNIVHKKVIRPFSIPTIIENLQTIHQTKLIDTKDIKKVSRLIIKQYEPPIHNLLKKFQIKGDEIIKGLHCPKCFHLPLEKKTRGWRCSDCYAVYQDVPIENLIDYLFLMGNWITNRQFRDFLQINSDSIATKVLKSLNAKTTGTYRNRKYELSYRELIKKKIKN